MEPLMGRCSGNVRPRLHVLLFILYNETQNPLWCHTSWHLNDQVQTSGRYIFGRLCTCCKCLCYFHPVFCPIYLSVTFCHFIFQSHHSDTKSAITWDPYQPLPRSFLYHLVQIALSLNHLNFRLTVSVLYLTIPLKGVLLYL